MKRARFTEEQIIGILREEESGDLARKDVLSEAMIYNWKTKFGGVDVSEAKRLKQLEADKAKLKKLLAEQFLDVAAMRELLSRNNMARRAARSRCASSGRHGPVGASSPQHRRSGQ